MSTVPGVVRCADRELDLRSPVVMGVLNVTPDSFSDGGRFVDVDAALHAALQMQRDGAAIIDVGGESTRPGSDPVPVDQELRRVVPVVRELVRRGVLVSVDTSKPEVITAALEAGAHLINDVYGLRLPGALCLPRMVVHSGSSLRISPHGPLRCAPVAAWQRRERGRR